MFVSYALIWTTAKTEIMKKHFSLELETENERAKL